MAEEQREAMEQQAAQPTSLLDEIIEASKIKPTDEGYDVTRAGLQEFIREIASSGTTPKVSGALLDAMIVELDKKLSAQVNVIMHDSKFRELESSWRSLKFLVDNVDFRQNTKVEILNVSKQDLIDDFEDSPEVVKSGLYKQIYTAEFGQFGGQPVGAVVSNFSFGPGPQDMELLRNVASVSAMSHVPFLASAGKEFFGIDSWDELPNLKDLHSIFEMPQYAKWRALRENEDSRYLGLTLPRFLLRLPYGENTIPAKNFNFTETADNNEEFCWGNTSFALASRMADSFAKFRWCSNIIGPQSGGAVENLPLYQFEQGGEIQTKIPTEVLISERREFELAEEGFIALTMRKGSDNAAFFSANSVLRQKTFPDTPEGKETEMNYKLSTQLPYMMIMNRLAHYIKVIQRENIGGWKERADIERELNVWISHYVTEMDNPDAITRSKRPLRMAKIVVSDVAGDPGWYSVNMLVRPHFKYMGANFTLSLVGKLDKK